MQLFLRHLFPNFILVSSMIYIWHKLLNRKIKFNDPKLYISLIMLMIISIINYFLVNKFIKIVIVTLVFMIFFKYLFNEKIQKCIITPIYYQLILIISETMYAILIVLLNIDVNLTITSPFVSMISNILISVFSICLVKFKITLKAYKKIIYMTDKIRRNHLLFLCLIIIMLANILLMSAYYRIDFKYLLIFNVVMIFICLMIVLYSLMTQNKYNKVSNKYNIAINCLRDNENMMAKYKIANHENKNLLLTIRAMILNKEEDIPKYIDSIVEEKYEDDEKLLFKMSVIPSGGLRATIYSKILKIKDNNIKYSLVIDKNLSTVDLIELDENTIIDICKIVGVFIDNAIEEVVKLRNKNIQINLFLEDNCLNIKVSNNYKNSIDLKEIYEEGYSTKGKGHGYGLPVVKQIVDRNPLLSNITEINKKLFSQILMIKYKKITNE